MFAYIDVFSCDSGETGRIMPSRLEMIVSEKALFPHLYNVLNDSGQAVCNFRSFQRRDEPK